MSPLYPKKVAAFLAIVACFACGEMVEGWMVDLPGRVADVFLDYPYVYLSNIEGGLRIVDVGDPNRPIEVGSWTPGWKVVRTFTIGDYAYTANHEEGLYILDVGDPTSIQIVGSWRPDEPCWISCVLVEEKNNKRYAYLGDRENRFWVLDVTDPSSPNELLSIEIPGHVMNLVVSAGYAYLAAGEGSLRVIDIQMPDEAHEVSSLDVGPISNIKIQGGVCFAGGWKGGVRLIDVSDPQAPSLLSVLREPSGPWDIFVSGRYLYVTDRDGVLRCVDVSDPRNPRLLCLYNDMYRAIDLAVRGDWGYIGFHDTGSLVVTRLHHPPPPLDLPGRVADVFLRYPYVYLSNIEGGLRIVDVRDPDRPREVGSWTPGWNVVRTFVFGRYAYTANREQGFYILDVGDPTSIQVVGSWRPDGPCYIACVFVEEKYNKRYAYLGDRENRFWIIDVTNPSSPNELLSIEIPGPVINLVASDGYAYLAAGDGGLHIMDVRIPEEAHQASSLDVGPISDIKIQGGVCFAGGWLGGVRLIDVSNPHAPSLLSVLEEPNRPWDIFVSGRYLYVTDRDGVLRCVDVSDPRDPTLLCLYNDIDRAIDLAVRDDWGYIGFHTGDLVVTRLNHPPRFTQELEDITCSPGTKIEIELHAEDPDSWDKLTFLFASTPTLPLDATINGNLFRWIPGEGDGGEYLVTFRVMDTGGFYDEVTIWIIVKAPPNVTILKPPPDGDKSGLAYDVKFKIEELVGGGFVRLFYDNDNTGYDGVEITRNPIAVRGAGVHKYRWMTKDVPRGKYYVYAELSDDINQVRSPYSGEVVIDDTLRFGIYGGDSRSSKRLGIFDFILPCGPDRGFFSWFKKENPDKRIILRLVPDPNRGWPIPYLYNPDVRDRNHAGFSKSNPLKGTSYIVRLNVNGR